MPTVEACLTSSFRFRRLSPGAQEEARQERGWAGLFAEPSGCGIRR